MGVSSELTVRLTQTSHWSGRNAAPLVLVVDDDSVTRGIVSAKVRGIGAQVFEAQNGAIALEHICQRDFNLVIVDLDMPEMGGIEMILRVRKELGLKHLPIVVLTGNEIRTALDTAVCAGATSFLQKPLNWLCFHPHIRHLLNLGSVSRE